MSQATSRRKFFRTCLCCSEAAVTTGRSRRNFLAGGVASLGLGTAAAVNAGRVTPAAAQTPAGKTRIDVHHHFIPPAHVEAMMKPGRRVGGPPPKWSPAMSLDALGQSGIP